MKAMLVGMLLLALAPIPHVQAAPQVEKLVPVLGPGNDTCSAWLKRRVEGRVDRVDSWIAGYFSALNRFKPPGKIYLLEYDSPHLVDAVARYCHDRPSDTVGQATQRFEHRLNRLAPRPMAKRGSQKDKIRARKEWCDRVMALPKPPKVCP